MTVVKIMKEWYEGVKKHKEKLYILAYIIFISISVIIVGRRLEFIETERFIRDELSHEIDYDEFRNVRITNKQIEKIIKHTNKVTNKNPELYEYKYIDYIGYLTFSMMLAEYDLNKNTVPNDKIFMRGIGRLSQTMAYQELYEYYNAIFSDIKYFPIPYMGQGAYNVSYNDSWYAPRSYGGDRSHEGTDLMAANNTRGYFPIISMTDGVVEKKGWLDKGGYRIGVRSKAGGYFYYAHLDTYAPELREGDTVIAGQLLGFMGDSGYGSEGTIGQFDVHLHMGIYVEKNESEISVNPYWILKMLEHSRTELVH